MLSETHPPYSGSSAALVVLLFKSVSYPASKQVICFSIKILHLPCRHDNIKYALELEVGLKDFKWNSLCTLVWNFLQKGHLRRLLAAKFTQPSDLLPLCKDIQGILCPPFHVILSCLPETTQIDQSRIFVGTNCFRFSYLPVFKWSQSTKFFRSNLG